MAATVRKRLVRQMTLRTPRDELRRYLDGDLEEDMVDPVKWWGVRPIIIISKTLVDGYHLL